MKGKMKFWGIGLLGLLLSSIPEISCDCRLQPISFGYYYGVTKLTFEEASKCCSSKSMNLISLTTDKDQLRDALVSSPFWAEPIGPANGIFVISSAIEQPHHRNYPRNLSESFNQVNLSSSSSVCRIAYLVSPQNISLTFAGVSCKGRFRYLCQRQTKTDPELCNKLNYTKLNKYLYGITKLDWRDAQSCCEEKGGEIFGPEYFTNNQDLMQSLTRHGILEKDIPFWSSALRKLDKTPFVWPNGELALLDNITAKSEFCISGKVWGENLSLIDFPCEAQLPSICRLKAPNKCPLVSLQKLPIENSVRQYYYSGVDKLHWSDAVLCCREKGLQLLSMISPREGNILASYFQASQSYRHRHQGLPHGLWTGGRQRTDKTFEFVSVRTRTTFEENGDNHFVQSANSNRTCLQYVIDTRNSYFLNNIPCNFLRSFICEKSALAVYNEFVELKELGNKYFISSRMITWPKATKICPDKGMSLLNLYNYEEKKALLPVLQVLGDEGEEFWTAPQNPVDINPLPYDERKKANQKNYQAFQKGLKTKRIMPRMTTTRHPNMGLSSNCGSLKVAEGQISVTISNNCTTEKRVICEKHVRRDFGVCDQGQFVTEGKFLFHPQAASWDEAKKCCHLMGREVISLDQLHKRKQVYEFLKRNDFLQPNIGIWTSGTNKYTKEKWAWAGIYEFLKINLFYNDYNAFDEMALAEDDNQCLEAFANLKRGKVALSNSGCDLLRPFLCDVKHVMMFKSCENIRFEKFGRSGIHYALSKVPWIQAQECCLRRNMTLVEIHNSTMNQHLGMIVSKMSDDLHADPDFGVWIGLTSHLSNYTTFTWTGSSQNLGERSNFTGWEESNPAKLSPNPNSACVEGYTKNKNFLWKPMPCSTELRFMCQSKN